MTDKQAAGPAVQRTGVGFYPIGDVLALLAILVWTVFFLASKRIRAKTATLEYFTAVLGTAAVALTPVMFLRGGNVTDPSARDWLLIVIVALGPGTGGHLLVTWAHRLVDVSGYTRLTEERGDEAAVLVAGRLQRSAEAAAAADGGRLVKLLGDGAMLRFPDARRGVTAALRLVGELGVDAGLTAHAGVHAGPIVERDLDLYGRTVNLASRISSAAGPGEVLVSENVVRSIGDDGLRFEPADTARLKGIAEPVALYRALPL